MAPNKKECKVRVLVRLRPERADYKERKSGNRDEIPERCVRAVDSSTLELWNCRNSEESIRYRFSGFFDEDSTQETLYHNSVCPLIPYVLQGHNASVFAYGPTGAGKTHTMVGSPEQPGLIPRCAAELFKLIDSHSLQDSSSQWKYKVLFSYLEIYQEKIKDLLDPKKYDLPVREDRQQNIIIPNLTEKPIATLGEFMSLFEKASQQRKTAATKLNPHSSRSHSIVLLKVLKQQQVAPFTKLSGKFYLIDLAGSEDNRRTGNEGIRLKESGAINGSLFALGQVVDALNQGLSRIPYRNSKLTRLLQDSLGGTAHACMIANIAPERKFYADTTNTLNFASKSRTIINEPFVRRTVDKSVAFKRPAEEALQPNQRKRPKLEDTSAAQKSLKPERKPVLPQKPAIPAGVLSPFRAEQRKLQERLAALEKLTREQAALQTTTNTEHNVSKGITTARQVPPSDQAPGFTRLPLKDANRSALYDASCTDSPQTPDFVAAISPPCKKRKTAESLTVDENFKVKINPHLQETHNSEILSVLNSGTIKELKKLQGVGQKRAQLIAEWRTVHGPFNQVQDLKLIDGFTDKMVTTFIKNNLLSRITFS